MKEYQKIANVYGFNPDRTVGGIQEPFRSLRGIDWVGTEKIDGTNTRVYWDGHSVEYRGRTDKANWDKEVSKALDELFLTQEMEYLFEQVFGEKEAYLYGETYGRKIQSGETYSHDIKFILFDVEIKGRDLRREDVDDVAEKLGLDSVPVVFRGNIDQAIEFVRKHPKSTIGDGSHEMEGLVMVPDIGKYLYDADGHMLKCKVKYRDAKRTEGRPDPFSIPLDKYVGKTGVRKRKVVVYNKNKNGEFQGEKAIARRTAKCGEKDLRRRVLAIVWSVAEKDLGGWESGSVRVMDFARKEYVVTVDGRVFDIGKSSNKN